MIQEDQLEAYGLGGNKGFVSTIGRSEHFKPEYRSTADKIGFESRRMIGQFKMAYRYLTVILKATKRYVALDKGKFKIK
ncbi:hypothetical protein [Acinetobacter indicus]|uniref:hypothetical protein n=1 Tax=Acinetobacter indicus TaxID=756892 RepID=UPI001443B4C8|nr:hypothetical protein [Acinetobacter indicus]